MTLVCLVLLTLLSGGCHQFAQVSVIRPAPIDVSGIQRLTVVPFSGEHGSAIASALTTQLWEGQFYSLVDQSELNPVRTVAHDPDQLHESIRHAARAVGVDGIITGEVIEYRCQDQVLHDTEFFLDQENDQHETEDYERTHVGFRHDERIHREATVTVAFQLIDADTGQIRLSHRASHSYQGVIGDDEMGGFTQGEILNHLSRECVKEFLQKMAPYEEACPMRLARPKLLSRGASQVRKGNRLAIEGDWEAAQAAWQAALEKNAQSDAALYNLALEAATHHRYDQAEELAMRAIRLKHCDEYAAGLERIREYRTAYEQTEDQHQEREQTHAEREFR